MRTRAKWLKWLLGTSSTGSTSEHGSGEEVAGKSPYAFGNARRMRAGRWCATPDLLMGRLRRGPTIWVNGIPCGQLYDPNDEHAVREAATRRQRIISDFTDHLGAGLVGPAEIRPVADLPHPKPKILDALLTELEVTGDFRAWNGMIRCAYALARYQELDGADGSELERWAEADLTHLRWCKSLIIEHRRVHERLGVKHGTSGQ